MNLKNISHTLSNAKKLVSKLINYKNGRKYIFLKFIVLICNSLVGIIGIVVPGLIINDLMNSIQNKIYNSVALIKYIILLLVIPTVCKIVFILIENLLFKIGEELKILLITDFELFVSKMDYESLEKPHLQEWRERVSNTVEGALEIADLIGNILLAFLTFCVSFSIITYLNPLIIIINIVIVFINSRMASWMNIKRFELRQEYSKHQRKYWSLTYMLRDFSYAKEIRLYRVAELLLKKANQAQRDLMKTTFKNKKNKNRVDFVLHITEFMQSLVLYIYLIFKVLTQALPIGSMTIYLSAARRFSGSISSVVNAYMALSERAIEIEEWEDFLKIPLKEKSGILVPQINAQSYIEFRNVSFKYPGSDSFALENVNLKLSCEQKLCIVGENGSGKSTFIKLLLRLYEPTSGEILINGINITQYDYNLYIKLFAPVFQDFSKFELTLKDNIILAENYDDLLFYNTCNRAGIKPLIDKLAKGVQTQIGKEIDPEGIEPSGGEGQRIAIARACYRGGKIFILDEPTAALDPNAEYEIYTQFNNMVTDKCAILITHRLSAVQLADNIAVFDQGNIVEYGTHKELYGKGGIYTEMFDKQAQFYRDDT